MKHTCIIIIIMAAAGILGGATNFFILFKREKKKINEAESQGEEVEESEVWWITLPKCILISLCASFTVPLLFYLLQSDALSLNKYIVKDIIPTHLPVEIYFYFAGFCVLAAFFAKKFLDDMYKKLNSLEKDTKDAKEKAKVAAVKAEEATDTAKEATDTAKEANEKAMVNEKRGYEFSMEELLKLIRHKLSLKMSSGARGFPSSSIDNEEEKIKTILNAIHQSKYNFRTLEGIAGEKVIKDKNINVKDIETILQSLEKEGLVEKKENSMGEDIWGLVI